MTSEEYMQGSRPPLKHGEVYLEVLREGGAKGDVGVQRKSRRNEPDWSEDCAVARAGELSLRWDDCKDSDSQTHRIKPRSWFDALRQALRKYGVERCGKRAWLE